MNAVPPITRGITMSTTLSYRSAAAPTRSRLSAEHITGLVGAAIAGDECAWNALVSEFGGMIWAVARAHRLRDADASEVSQATWLRLFEHLGKLKDPARVGAWLATTARRECLRVLRENERCVVYGDDAPEHVSPDMSPDDVALLGERDEALWLSFARLRSSDQALLRLLMADPRPPYEEIAAALDMPVGSIGPTRQRALERLRNELRGRGTLSLLID
jgi:RNA polymerase sigma factor (sigma-70 family)